VSDSIPELQQAIRCRCQRVLNARDDCPKAGLLFFYQAVRQVLSASSEANQEELRALQLRVNDIIEALKMPGTEMAKRFSAPADGKSSCGLSGALLGSFRKNS
jgi:hypothetical protein